MKKNLALLLTLCSFATAAKEPCKQGEASYQQCETQIGWYVGGALGFAETNSSKNKIDKYFKEHDLNIDNIKVDDDDFGSNLFIGYQFNSYFALEAGYLELGDRKVNFSGETTDKAAYYDAAEHVYPQSADGVMIALTASWPVTDEIKLSAKVGYFDWEGDYITYDDQGNQGDDNIKGHDVLFGGEVNYRLADNTQLFLAYQQVELERDTNEMWSLGFRYYFGHEDSPIKTKTKTKPKAKSTPQLAAAITPKDSDNDGVFDKQDACPGSDYAYQVDSKGCTLEKAQWVDFSLAINFANDSAKIDAKYHDKIIELANFINRHKVKTLTVFGHTSAVGYERYNIKLSKQRANAIAEKLAVDFNIDAAIINAVGKGETELKVSGDTEQAHQQNRRIELTIKEQVSLPVKR